MRSKNLSAFALVCTMFAGSALAENGIVTIDSFLGTGPTEAAACQGAKFQAKKAEENNSLLGKAFRFEECQCELAPFKIRKNSVCNAQVRLLIDQKIPENQWRSHLQEMCVQDTHWECLMAAAFRFPK